MFQIHADIHLHEASDPLLAKVDALARQLTQLGDTLMARSDEVLAIVNDLNVETNALAAKLDALSATVANGTIGPAEIAQLQAVSDRLKALAADPANPVPPQV